MLILCPSCNANYEVPESRMRPGRRVRCAACGTEWMPVAEPADPDPIDPEHPRFADDAPPPAPVVSEADRLSSVQPSVARRSPALRVAWAASIALLLIAAAGAVAWRTDVMHAWPASTRLYDKLGLGETAGLASR
jgi:predicted Zn finger-like uncharacterized protein